METNSVSRRYETRSTTAEPVAKSRIDWNLTKRCLFPESQDDDDEITSSSSLSSEKDPVSPVSRRYETRSTTAESVAKSRVDQSQTFFPEGQDDDDEITSFSSSSSEKDPVSPVSRRYETRSTTAESVAKSRVDQSQTFFPESQDDDDEITSFSSSSSEKDPVSPVSRRYETRSTTAESVAKSRSDQSQTFFPESQDDDDEITSFSSSSSEKDPVSRRYKTRSTTAEPVAKSRIDWNRTKRYQCPESQDDDDEITSSSSSSSSSSSEKDPKSSSKDDVDGKEEGTAILSKSHGEAGSNADLQKVCSDVSSEDSSDEEENISFGKRKRSRTAVIHDSDESSDSNVPRKVIAKGRSVITENNLSVGEESPTSPEEKAANRKRERNLKLQELSYRQSQKSGKVNQRDERSADDAFMQQDGHSPLTQEEIGVMSNEDSMKNFIDDEEEEEEEEGKEKLEWDNFEEEDYQHQDRKHHVASNLLEKHVAFVSEVDHYLHFQRVVKAFLINAIDDTFLSSLYEGKRQKKYAQDMQTSLYYFDEHFIQPYLESIGSGCRWKERYRKRLDNYSDVHIKPQRLERRICQACELDRNCGFLVIFSGNAYCHKTLKVDDFIPHDTQRLKVGVVCQRRTQVYHDLKHYKYKLYQECCSAIKDQCLQDEPVKDLVKRVFSQLEENGWIREKYSDLKNYQDEVAEFHKFLRDFKRELLSSERRY